MRAEEILLNTLKSLLKKDFDVFKWYLAMHDLDGYEIIDKCDLEDADRPQTVTLLIRNYGEEVAVQVTVQVLRKMSNRDAAEKLEKKYAASKPAAPPPAAPPAAPAPAPFAAAATPSSMTAQQGSAIVAPSMSGCNVQTMNITISK